MHSRFPRWVLRKEGLTPSARLVLIDLHDRCIRNGSAASINELAAESQVCESAVRNALRILSREGLVAATPSPDGMRFRVVLTVDMAA